MKTLLSPLLFLVICVFLQTGCEQNSSQPTADNRPDFAKGLPFGTTDWNVASKASNIENYLGVEVRRHGLVYFPYTGKQFMAAYEKFFDAHPELEGISIAGDSDSIESGYSGERRAAGKVSDGAISGGHSDYTTHAGYFVLTRGSEVTTAS